MQSENMIHMVEICKKMDVSKITYNNLTGISSNWYTFEWIDENPYCSYELTFSEPGDVIIVIRQLLDSGAPVRNMLRISFLDKTITQKEGYDFVNNKQTVNEYQRYDDFLNEDTHFQRSTMQDLPYSTEDFKIVVQKMKVLYNAFLTYEGRDSD